MANIKARWLVSLSDGTMALEDKHPYENIPGQVSPYQRMIRHVRENKLDISGIRIQIEKEGEATRTYNLVSKSPKQKWGGLSPMIPNELTYKRRVQQSGTAEPNEQGGYDVQTGSLIETHFIEIHAIYDNFSLVTIVDEDSGTESWSLIIPNQ